ncbi:precorrin-6A/cobalt-precorrin-6A reductase, partial [Gemmiger formicilis]
MEQADMIPVLQDKTLCIDATHPYATQVTQNIREAA